MRVAVLFMSLCHRVALRLTAALRHCEERSNPDNMHTAWIASSFLLAMTRSVWGAKPIVSLLGCRSSHVIPTLSCALAWKSKIRRSQSMAVS